MSEDVKAIRAAIANMDSWQNRAQLSYNEIPADLRDMYELTAPTADWTYADILVLALAIACMSIGEDPLFSLLPRHYREAAAEHVYKSFL